MVVSVKNAIVLATVKLVNMLSKKRNCRERDRVHIHFA